MRVGKRRRLIALLLSGVALSACDPTVDNAMNAAGAPAGDIDMDVNTTDMGMDANATDMGMDANYSDSLDVADPPDSTRGEGPIVPPPPPPPPPPR